MAKLYVIEEPDQLTGKTIAFAMMDSFNSALIIGTVDGGVMACEATTSYDTDNDGVAFCGREDIEHYLFWRETLRNNVIRKTTCREEDVTEFLAEYTAKLQEETEFHNKQQEERDRQEYERLKKKFEEGNND